MHSSFLRSGLAFCSLAIILMGCGEKRPPTGYCVGKMTIDGAPPTENVRIIFMDSIRGFSGSGAPAANGHYAIKDLRLGEYVVYFEKGGVVVNGDKSNGEISTDADRLNTVPAKYRTEASSPLKIAIEEGKNTFDFDIPNPAKK